MYYKCARLSESFYEKLKLIDMDCDAVLDRSYIDTSSTLTLPESCIPVGAIHVWRTKNGKQNHEITVSRKLGEPDAQLEARTIIALKEGDIFKKYDGNALLYEEEIEKFNEKRRKDLEDNSKSKRIDSMLTTNGDTIRSILVDVKRRTPKQRNNYKLGSINNCKTGEKA